MAQAKRSRAPTPIVAVGKLVHLMRAARRLGLKDDVAVLPEG